MAGVKKVLFWPDVYKEQGHWLPTLKWAQDLYDFKNPDESKPYSIEYMGIIDCEDIIKSYPIEESSNVNETLETFQYHKIFEKTYPKGYTTACHTSPNERWKPDHIWAIAYSALKEDLPYYRN